MGQEGEEQKDPRVVPPSLNPLLWKCRECNRFQCLPGPCTSALLPLPPCQMLLIPHGPCTTPGQQQPVCKVLPGSAGHRHWHCHHALPPPWGCAWAPGCCGCCGNASTSSSAAGASVSCWTRGGPPRCHRRPCQPLPALVLWVSGLPAVWLDVVLGA